MIKITTVILSLIAALLTACASDPTRGPPCMGRLTPINPATVRVLASSNVTTGVVHERR